MSECVVRMEMPQDCGECRFRSDGWCYGIREFDIQPGPLDFEKRPSWCPIICSLPDGHGRLVDADACAGVLRKLENEAVKPTGKLCFGYAAKMFEEAFTIVPAEAEGSE